MQVFSEIVICLKFEKEREQTISNSTCLEAKLQNETAG